VEAVVLRSPNLPWDRFPLGAALSRRAGVPVALEDDANAGALGEALLGAGAGRDPVLYLTLSTGVGAGVVAGGQLVRGAHQAAGEIGHLGVDPGGPRCGCGGRGHVEAYVGGASLARRARAAWAEPRLPDGSPAPRDAAGIFRLARRGDPVAAAIVEEAAGALAAALAAATAVLDPGVIVIGGSLARAQRGLVRRAVTRARGMVIAEAGRALAIVPAALGDRSPLAGAALAAGRLVLDPYLGPGEP
jgi:glucokinase